jgi:hypothetical protein
MKNLNRGILYVFFVIIILAGSMSAFAGTLLIFDNPRLVALESDGEIVGYYGTHDRISSCGFFFSTIKEEGHSSELNRLLPRPIETHVLAGPVYDYSHRDSLFDIPGKLFQGPQGWMLQTSETQAGCNNASGTFKYGPDDLRAAWYFPVKKMPAMNIRVIGRRTFLYVLRGGKLSATKFFLTGGSAVVIIDRRQWFSNVRFVHPSTGKIAIGWVHTADLLNPFPPSTDH